MAQAFRIVTLGDSVTWGQGLPEAQKFDSMVRDALGHRFPGGVSLQRFAHSGAVIAANPVTGNSANGEVPVSRPTIVEQCDGFSDSPDTVDLVLVNGGINDVGVTKILIHSISFRHLRRES
jgi:lysophospholipase L1-like esterase